jgi:hypothetical protein
MLLPGLYQQLQISATVKAALGAAAADSIFIDLAQKQAPRPHLVMTLVSGPPAEASLDGIAQLMEGEIQFDSYADKPQDARTLSNAVRDYLMTTFNAGALPDGTTIQFVDVTVDHNEQYELGGVGYLYRVLLRLKAFYTEHA